MYSVIVFDLDGTLADTKYGIMSSAKYALLKMNVEIKNEDELKVFVGPTLWHSFGTHYNMNEEEQQRAVDYYREDYMVRGIYECKLFDGVKSLLKGLKEKNIKIAIATAKPQKSAEIVLEHLGIDKYIDYVAGSMLDGSRSDKKELISLCLDKLKEEERNACMVGDSKSDGVGANEVGVDFIGILNDRVKEDFEGCRVDFFVDNIYELEEKLLKDK